MDVLIDTLLKVLTINSFVLVLIKESICYTYNIQALSDYLIFVYCLILGQVLIFLMLYLF